MEQLKYKPSELVIRKFPDGEEFVALRHPKEEVEYARAMGVKDYEPYEEQEEDED